MRSFPFPLRVAAGLAATAVEQTRRLPGNLVGLPVTVASRTLQLSMQLQQHVTELAIRGDEALAGFRTVEEQPEWATFDEDESPPPGPPGGTAAEEGHDAPGALPDYDELTLPQVRGKLRRLSENDLVELLEHERAHQRRPEFERMLSNRLETVRAARR